MLGRHAASLNWQTTAMATVQEELKFMALEDGDGDCYDSLGSTTATSRTSQFVKDTSDLPSPYPPDAVYGSEWGDGDDKLSEVYYETSSSSIVVNDNLPSFPLLPSMIPKKKEAELGNDCVFYLAEAPFARVCPHLHPCPHGEKCPQRYKCPHGMNCPYQRCPDEYRCPHGSACTKGGLCHLRPLCPHGLTCVWGTQCVDVYDCPHGRGCQYLSGKCPQRYRCRHYHLCPNGYQCPRRFRCSHEVETKVACPQGALCAYAFRCPHDPDCPHWECPDAYACPHEPECPFKPYGPCPYRFDAPHYKPGKAEYRRKNTLEVQREQLETFVPRNRWNTFKYLCFCGPPALADDDQRRNPQYLYLAEIRYPPKRPKRIQQIEDVAETTTDNGNVDIDEMSNVIGGVLVNAEREKKLKIKWGERDSVDAEHAVEIARKAGYAPSNAEIKQFEFTYNYIGLDELKTYASANWSHDGDKYIAQDIINLFDTANRGSVGMAKLIHFLSNYGEKLSETEVEAIYTLLGKGEVKSGELTRILLT